MFLSLLQGNTWATSLAYLQNQTAYTHSGASCPNVLLHAKTGGLYLKQSSRYPIPSGDPSTVEHNLSTIHH